MRQSAVSAFARDSDSERLSDTPALFTFWNANLIAFVLDASEGSAS